MESKKTTKNDAADIKATVKDILKADKAETTVKKAASTTAKKTTAKAEEKKTETKTTAKKTETKAPAKKAEAKAPAKKAETKTATKSTAKKAAAPKAILQIWGNDIDVAEIIEKAQEAYKSNSKKKNLKELYIKPEEGKAYYVADDDSGSVDLW